jgi:hypothetical protein
MTKFQLIVNRKPGWSNQYTSFLIDKKRKKEEEKISTLLDREPTSSQKQTRKLFLMNQLANEMSYELKESLKVACYSHT